MDPDTPITPTNDQQPTTDAATTTEPATQAATTDTAPSAIDLIAAAVGAEPATPEAPAVVAATPDPAAPPVELTPEQKAKAEDERLEAEAKAFGITKPDTTTKFKELSREAAKVKELEPRITELTERVAKQDEVFTFLEDNGVTGDQFGQAVAVLSHINSGDPVRLQRAYEALGEQMAAIGAKLGLEAPGYDPLAAHADLQAKVANMDLSREDALEIAQGRQLKTAATTHSSKKGSQDNERREIDQATRDLTALETHLRATDPQFAAKWAALGPTLVPILSRVPLLERASEFHKAYAAFQLPAAPAEPATTRPDPANPGRPAMGAGAKAPSNSAEAIMLSLGVG